MRLRWTDREPPLPVQGVLARGDVMRALLTRLLEDQGPLEALRGVISVGREAPTCVLLGDPEKLPWVDGVVYLGRPAHTNLYLPTTRRAEITDALLERVLGRALSERGPLAALPAPEGALLFPLAAARPLTRDHLRRHLKAHP